MSDDEIWRDDAERRSRQTPRTPGRYERAMDEFDEDEFGGPLFAETAEQPVSSVDPGPGDPGEPERHREAPDLPVDDPTGGGPPVEPDPSGSVPPDERLSFGADDTGPLPHWTEPPTGEIPKIETARASDDPTDDVDVWSSFTTESPVWKEGDHVDDPSGTVGTPPPDPTGELTWEDDVAGGADSGAAPIAEPPVAAPSGASGPGSEEVVVTGSGRESERIMIGTDPSGMPRRPDPRRRDSRPQRPPSSRRQPGPPEGRNLPIAVASGLVLAAAFLALTMWRPAGAVAFVTALLAVGSVEYFSRVTEKGYRPAVAVGVLASIAAPLGAYWVGERIFPILLAFAFLAGAIGFIAADSIEAGPMPNMAITMLGITWIGVMGAFAGLILAYSTLGGGTSWGTDTLVLLAIGVVANDVGAYFVGTAFGRTPLRAWISPNKSIEGFLGGAVLTLVVMLVIGLQDLSDTWSNTTHLLLLAVVISVMAPLGDLTESMFKRNLDVKDFGSIVQGHGGILDRFDGFLFCLPAVYYLFLVLEPWTEFVG